MGGQFFTGRTPHPSQAGESSPQLKVTRLPCGAVSAHAHAHGAHPAQDAESVARRRTAIRIMLAVLVPVAVATLVGLVVLWPGGGPSAAQRAAAAAYTSPGTTYPQATVVQVDKQPCADAGGGPSRQTCATAVVRVEDGAGAGRYVQVQLPPDAVASGVEVGTKLVLTRDPAGTGAATGAGGPVYQFADFARSTPMVALALAFVLVVGAVARLRGLAAVLGLGVAFGLLLKFMLPALLAGESPTWVSLVGSAAIMFVVLYLAHGFSVRTTTALIGTLSGLALVAGLGAAAVGIAKLTGFSSDATVTLQQFDPDLNFGGLVLAGVVVAGLGVLNDVTVTQASAVWEIAEASPQLDRRSLFARGMAIGRDHIASTVYTIVFAYAGAALPLLMLFEISQRPLWTVITGAQIGEEIIRTLVGVIALVLTVPVTTAVGALLATATRHSRTRPAPIEHHHTQLDPYDDREDVGAHSGTDRYSPRPARAGGPGSAFAPPAADTRPAMPALPPPPVR